MLSYIIAVKRLGSMLKSMVVEIRNEELARPILDRFSSQY